MKSIDARGLSCPEPVMLTKQALSQKGAYEIIVDNHTSKEKVSAFIQEQGLPVTVTQKEDDFYIQTEV